MLDRVLHARLEHDVAILAVPLGPVHRDVRVAQEFLGHGVISRGDPDARGHAHAGLFVRAELEWLLERVEHALGDELGPCRQREALGDHDELVPAQAPQRIGAAYGAVEPCGDRSQQFVADAVAERVVDGLEVVEIDEQRRHRRLGATRAREHLLDTIQDQCAVRQPGQRVVCRQERELLLAPRELFVRALALGLEALAHPQQAELEAQLQDVQSFRARLG